MVYSNSASGGECTVFPFCSGAGAQSFYFPSRNLSSISATGSFGVSDRLVSNISNLNPGTDSFIGPEYGRTSTVIYFFLQIFGGHFGIPVILLTFFLKKDLQKHPLLINFLVTWVLYASSFCLLLYVGRQFGPEPPVDLCLSQASLIYGTAVMVSMAGLAFVIHLWFVLNAIHTPQFGSRSQVWRNYILLAAPYVLFVLFTVGMAIVGSAYPSVISRNKHFFYCTINLNVVDIIPGLSLVLLVGVVCFEILIGVRLYQLHKAFTLMKARQSATAPTSLVGRVAIFTMYSILSLLACIGFWSQTGEEAPYMIQASLPTAAFLIFGSQKDLLHAWGLVQLWNYLGSRITGVKNLEGVTCDRPRHRKEWCNAGVQTMTVA